MTGYRTLLNGSQTTPKQLLECPYTVLCFVGGKHTRFKR